MKKWVLTLTLFLTMLATAQAATECDVWLGTWDVTYEDGSTHVWVIDKIVTGTSGNIICQAQGTTTPTAGGETKTFQIIRVTFYTEFIYTESPKLGEEMSKQDLILNDAHDAFTPGPLADDYGIKSGTKRVSGPRCGGLEPSYASAGDKMLAVTINGTETNFDNQTTTVSFLCPEVQLVETRVVSPTQVIATINLADNATDDECTLKVTTGSQEILCSLNIRGIGDTERVVWTFETGNIVASSPAVANGFVYFGSVDANVYCLNAETGAKIWEYKTGDSVFSCPAVTSEYVYVGSNDHKLYCLNAQTGAKVWEFATEGEVQSSPALYNNRIYVGSYDNKLYCVDAATGEKLWDFESSADFYSTPAVVDGYVYVGGVDYRMYCLNAETGASVWEFTTAGDIPPSPAVNDGKVYFGSKDASFYCVDAATGTKLWSFATGDIVFDSPAISKKGYVYFGSLDNKVYCLDAETGTKAWEFLSNGQIQSSPAVTKEYVHIGSSDGNLYCLDAELGTRMWSYRTGGVIYSSPAVSDGRVYVGSFDKRLYCLKAADDEDEAWPMFRYNLTRTGSRAQASCIAAQVLGADNPKLETLRKFRDEILSRSVTGKKLISLYYSSSDQLTVWCRQYPVLNKASESFFNSIVPVIAAIVQQE